MNPEPLRGKHISDLLFIKSEVKSAVEFYKKYRYDGIDVDEISQEKHFKMLQVDCENAYRRWCIDVKQTGEDWNDWLFDYCFGDVIE